MLGDVLCSGRRKELIVAELGHGDPSKILLSSTGDDVARLHIAARQGNWEVMQQYIKCRCFEMSGHWAPTNAKFQVRRMLSANIRRAAEASVASLRWPGAHWHGLETSTGVQAERDQSEDLSLVYKLLLRYCRTSRRVLRCNEAGACNASGTKPAAYST